MGFMEWLKGTRIQPRTPTKFWPYSYQYDSLLREGLRNPPTACGSPTFVWHVGLWPNKPIGNTPSINLDEGEDSKELNIGARINRSFAVADDDLKQFYDEVSDFLEVLQKRGRIDGDQKDFDFARFSLETATVEKKRRRREDLETEADAAAGAEGVYAFRKVVPQSLSFTIWWLDGEGVQEKVSSAPPPEALRVTVIAQSQIDHVTLSFHIDASKPYDHTPLGARMEPEEQAEFFPEGSRRAKIMEYVKEVRRISGDQIRSGRIDAPKSPEGDVSAEDARTLADAVDYFYDEIWRQFIGSFNIDFDTFDEKHFIERVQEGDADINKHDPKAGFGRRFADFRGVVLAVRGLDTPRDDRRRRKTNLLKQRNAPKTPPTPGVDALGRAQDTVGRGNDQPVETNAHTGIGALDVFDAESGEPNSVLKSFLPFLRRMEPWADYRRFIGCGIISWRALYVSALGASDFIRSQDEFSSRTREVEHDALPISERLLRVSHAEDLKKIAQDPEDLKALETAFERMKTSRPLRYLILTKGEPHREQIGRFVERINTLGTMRLFALKYYDEYLNASTHLRVLGNELDGILSYWARKRREIDNKYEKISFKNSKNLTKTVKKRQERDDELDALIEKTEAALIELGSRLDYMFHDGVGRLSYSINRSCYFASEFERLWPFLETGNVDGWMNYEQFVQRGPKPAFDFIKLTGERLVSLRERLQVVTETIQTTALIVETDATRANTAALLQIAILFRLTAVFAVFSFIFITLQWLAPSPRDVVSLAQDPIGYLQSLLDKPSGR